MSKYLSKILPFLVMAVFLPALASMAVKEPRLLLVIWGSVVVCSTFGEFVFTGFSRPILHAIGNLLYRKHPEKQFPIDWSLPTHGTLWNMLVYGLSVTVTFPLVDRFFPRFYSLPILVNGLIGTIVTYVWEYGWHRTIKRLTGRDPWRYRYPFKYFDKFEATQIVNPLYAPFWFGFSFVLQWIHLHVVPNAPRIYEMIVHHQPWQLHP